MIKLHVGIAGCSASSLPKQHLLPGGRVASLASCCAVVQIGDLEDEKLKRFLQLCPG